MLFSLAFLVFFKIYIIYYIAYNMGRECRFCGQIMKGKLLLACFIKDKVESLFIGLEEYYCIFKKSCIKPFVAPEGVSVG